MTTSPPPPYTPGPDALGPAQSAPHAGGPRNVLMIVGAVAAVAVASTAIALAGFLGGGGAQPEDVIPSDALAFAKIDLDPAAGQKVAVFRLAKRFPSTGDKVQDEDGVKDQLLSALFEGNDEVDYDTDIAPWIGDRVGVAAVPSGGDEPGVLAAIAYTDRDGAEAAMRRLQDSDEDGETFFAFSDKADYVLLGDTQATVDAAAGTAQVLADAPAWTDAMKALDGDQIVTAWADLGAVWDAVPEEQQQQAAEQFGLDGGFDLDGTVVLGARAASNYVEVVGRTLDLKAPELGSAAIGTGEGSNMAGNLPADTIAAMSITNLGAGLADLFDTVYAEAGDDPYGIIAGAEDFGVSLPDDLRTLLGEQTLAAVLGEEDFGLRARTRDVDAAYRTAEDLARRVLGDDPSSGLRRLDDGIAVGSTPEALEAISGSDGGLGKSEVFTTAVPDADRAGAVVYVDIARAIEVSGEDLGEDAQDAAALQSFGLTSSGDRSDGAFRMRLTVR